MKKETTEKANPKKEAKVAKVEKKAHVKKAEVKKTEPKKVLKKELTKKTEAIKETKKAVKAIEPKKVTIKKTEPKKEVTEKAVKDTKKNEKPAKTVKPAFKKPENKPFKKKFDNKSNVKKPFNNTKEMTIEELEEAMKTGQVFDTLVKSVDDMLNLNVFFAHGIKGVIPREEISSIVAENGLVDDKVCLSKDGKVLQASIKEIRKKEGKLDLVILSCKELELKVRRWMFMHLKEGMKLKGVVRGMTDYAAFVDVGGGVTGMLKLEDISYIRINKVSDKLWMGERLEVIVKRFDRDTGKIDLSIKDLNGDFKARVSKIKEGSMVDGVVRNREKNGIFVELGNDLVGLAEHVSGVEYGQKVLVHIKKINIEKERIKVKIIG